MCWKPAKAFSNGVLGTAPGRRTGPRPKHLRLPQVHERRGDQYGPELREADAVHAEAAVQAELRRRGWREAELKRRRNGDPSAFFFLARAGRYRVCTARALTT